MYMLHLSPTAKAYLERCLCRTMPENAEDLLEHADLLRQVRVVSTVADVERSIIGQYEQRRQDDLVKLISSDKGEVKL